MTEPLPPTAEQAGDADGDEQAAQPRHDGDAKDLSVEDSDSSTAEPTVLRIQLAHDTAADSLLARSPFALLVAMVLDPQTYMEKSFAGPYLLSQRMGRELSPVEVVGYDPQDFVALIGAPPPVHKSPEVSARRIRDLATFIMEHYGGDTTRLWTEISTGGELQSRLRELPGFGRTRAQIMLALLGKQFGIVPTGWREAAGEYGEDGTRASMADVTDPQTLEEVRAVLLERKAEAAQRAKAAKSKARAARKGGPPTSRPTS